jgi:uncharacterized damage-inducible protein DinB
MLVRRLNLAWKSGHPNQCLRLGDNAKTDRTLRARFRESASYGSALIFRATTCFLSTHALHEKPISLLANHSNKFFHAKLGEPNPMKHPFLLLAAALFLGTTSAYAQATKSSPATGASTSPSTPPTVASAIDREISIVEKEVVEAAEAMPENKFDFSPEKLNISGSDYKGVRTFGQQLKHVAASNYLIWSPITGEKAPDTVNDGKGPDNMTAKADIVKYLKDSFAFGHKAVATLNASNLVQPITSSSGRPTTRLFLATFAAAHAFDHYGQMVEYLRMNGIIPPASRGR